MQIVQRVTEKVSEYVERKSGDMVLCQDLVQVKMRFSPF